MWKIIPGFSNYAINKAGDIKRVSPAGGVAANTFPGKVLKPSTSIKTGYLEIGLYDESKKQRWRLVHRLVMLTFEGICPTGYEVNHKDGVKSNPHYDNLEYITHSQNSIHAYATGLMSSERVSVGTQQAMARPEVKEKCRLESLKPERIEQSKRNLLLARRGAR